MDKGYDLSELFSDPVLRDYLGLTDRAIRLAVSRISADCELLSDEQNGVSADRLNDIINMCCRLVQVSELYGMLTRDFDGEKKGGETIDVSAYLAGFTKGCTALIGEVCQFELGEIGEVYASVTSDMLTYLLLAFVRRAVLGGAVRIIAGCGYKDGKAQLSLTAAERKEPRYQHFEDFQYLYFDSIAGTLSGKLGAEYELTDDRFTVILPYISGGDADLCAPVLDYEAEAFSVFRIMLNDLGDADNF